MVTSIAGFFRKSISRGGNGLEILRLPASPAKLQSVKMNEILPLCGLDRLTTRWLRVLFFQLSGVGCMG